MICAASCGLTWAMPSFGGGTGAAERSPRAGLAKGAQTGRTWVTAHLKNSTTVLFKSLYHMKIGPNELLKKPRFSYNSPHTP